MLELLKKYRTPLLAGCLILAALLFYSARLRQRENASLFERTILAATAPLQEGLETVTDGLQELWTGYLWLVRTAAENERLAAETRRLQAELQGLEEVRLENERLSRLLAFREETALPALPARVIAEDASSWFRTVMIDRGLADGVREGMPVVVAEGVVGRIIKSGPKQSRVLLVTDASSAMATLVQRNRARGVCRGEGELLNLEFVLRGEEVEEGDLVITSGTGGVFPKGLIVGTVSRVDRKESGLFQDVKVTPSVDFYRLEEVLVLLKEKG